MQKVTKKPLSVILRRIVKLGSGYVYQRGAGNRWTAEVCCLGPEDLEAAAATLIEEFGIELLRGYHLLDPQQESPPQLKRDYSPHVGPMLGITFDESGSFRLVTEADAARLPAESLRKVLWDRVTRQLLLQRDGFLLLTENVEQTVVLRSLRLPAAPLGRLASLSNEPLVKLASLVRQTQNTLREQQKDIEITLVLANWSPLDRSAAQRTALREQAEFLAQVSRSRSIDLGDVAVWDPTPDEERELNFAVDHGNQDEVWTAVRNSVRSSSYSVARFSHADFPWQQQPADYVQAMHALQESFAYEARHGEPDPRRAERLKKFTERVDHDLVTPLFEQAFESKDPLQRVLWSCAAETARTVQLQSPGIRRQLALLSDVVSDEADAHLREQLDQQLRSTRDLLQLAKVLRGK